MLLLSVLVSVPFDDTAVGDVAASCRLLCPCSLWWDSCGGTALNTATDVVARLPLVLVLCTVC